MRTQDRIESLQYSLAAHHLDALLVSHAPNIRYLCGFTGSSGLLLVTESKSALFTDGRYTAQASQEVKNARVIIARNAPILTVAAEWLLSKDAALGRRSVRVGIDGEHLSAAANAKLRDALPARFRLRLAFPLVEQARMVKDPEEIARIRKAAELGAGLFQTALSRIRPGVTETKIAAAMEFEARSAGADGMSFETIIAAGARSALPHGRASQAAISRNGFVVCDFGVILSGYCSDRTRTVYVGSPTLEARRAYSAVLEAQQAAISAVRAGVRAEKVDRAARKILQAKELGRYFTHSTGHGVGLEIHEAPRLAKGQQEALRAGMVITIEPGIYIPGKFGVRIEDMVVVTERGCEVLAPGNKELITI